MIVAKDAIIRVCRNPVKGDEREKLNEGNRSKTQMEKVSRGKFGTRSSCEKLFHPCSLKKLDRVNEVSRILILGS